MILCEDESGAMPELEGERGESRIMLLCRKRSCLAIIKPPELELNKKCPRCGFPRFSGEENRVKTFWETQREA